jgi:RNA polymerase sigma-70 factor (ECF subfamily)
MGEKKIDQALVERVQRGDKAAFDILVLKYQHKIVKLISRYVRDHSEVLDVAQEAFIKAYRALPRQKGGVYLPMILMLRKLNNMKVRWVLRSMRPLKICY